MLKKTQTTQSVFNDIRKWLLCHFIGFPGGSDGEESAYNAGDLGSVPGLGRSAGEGNGYPLHYSFLENPMDRGAWWATIHGVTKSQTRLKQLNVHTSWKQHEGFSHSGVAENQDLLWRLGSSVNLQVNL